MNNRVSSIYPPNTGEYVSPFTAPAMPNLRTLGSALHKPVAADSAHIPRSPLTPQKLAKLANALGISTPLPASTPPPSASKSSFSSARSVNDRASPEPRSVTPSSAAGRSSSTRYLIHVIPPKHFPHENRKDPEAFAAFRRGSLVPLQATLQAQLGAISREFQLPTSHGLVLYLVNDSELDGGSKRLLGKGPRIGDEVWRWLWMKVAEEQSVARGVGLGLMSGVSSSDLSEQPSRLRKLSSSPQLDSLSRTSSMTPYPLTPSSSSPSTSTSAYTLSGRKDSKEDTSLEQSSSSQFSSTSATPALDTPATSSLDLDSKLLPGLGSSSLIPVLAKVEFDIDRKVGTWYETWSRSRKSMQKRRVKNVDPQGKLQLRITINNKKGTISPLSSSSDEEDEGYKRLSESPDPIDLADQLTARASPRRGDPLADVFGTDGDTWSDLNSGRSRPAGKGEHDLALDGAALSALSDVESADPQAGVSDREEVMGLWNERGQPQLNGGSARAGPHGMRKHAPPPLNIASHDANLKINLATGSPYTDLSEQRDSESGEEDGLYKERRLGGIYDDVELDLSANFDMDEHRASQLRVRQELDVLERNLAQFSPRALKSVELSPDLMPSGSPYLRSAPPGAMSFTTALAQSPPTSAQSVQLSSSKRETRRLVPTIQQLQPARPSVMEMEDEVTADPPMFRQPMFAGAPSPDVDRFKGTNRLDTVINSVDGSSHESTQVAWPAVPYTALANRGEDGSLSPTGLSSNRRSRKLTNSPPKLVLNGETNGLPNTSGDKRKGSLSISSLLSNGGSPRDLSESQARTRQYEEEAGFYSEAVNLQPSLTRRPMEASDAPALPLSPDPFGRFPSSAYDDPNAVAEPPERTSSLAKQNKHGRQASKAPPSRFSVDSVGEDPANLKVNNRTTLMSMKSIRKLWRNKNKSSVSGQSLPPSPDPSTMPSRPPSSATSVQYAEMDTSRTPSPSVSYSQTISSGRVSAASTQPAYHTQKPSKSSRPDSGSGLDPFYLDQDSKYPNRRSPSPQGEQQYQFPKTPVASASTQMSPPTPGTERKRASVRKSIMKHKNGSEGSSQSGSAGSISEGRRRRPSIPDMTGLARGSASSPSVPELPAAYRMSQHARAQSRASVSAAAMHMHNNSAGEERPPLGTNTTRRKPAPQSSTDSSQESTDPIPTPVSAVGPMSFAKGGGVLVSPGGSEGTRSSFDESQFEIVSPKVGRFASAITYSRSAIDGE
ncbi:hypothetical protein M0805_000919 [Coniferiporia weirii]|nr:hypothetical protein M0805_000919 [Coniferiporia weirii]